MDSPMNNKIKIMLKLVAITPLAATASPLAYPTPHQWHFTAGADTGISTYNMKWQRNDTYEVADGSAVGLGLSQSMGYSRWFYLQLKESFYGDVTSWSGSSDSLLTRRTHARFFDADARVYFPIPLSQDYRISLQPQIGYAMHYIQLKARGASISTVNTKYTRYRFRSHAPLAGLALGYVMNDCFNFCFGVAFEILSAKDKYQPSAIDPATDWQKLRLRRGALHTNLDMSYKAGKNLELTGSIEHLSYAPQQDATADATTNDFSYMNRFTYKAGLRWNF